MSANSNSLNPNNDAYGDSIVNHASPSNPLWPSRNPGVPSGTGRGNNPPGRK